MKPLNLLAFLLGLSLAFVPFAHAESICRTVQNLSGGSQNVWVGDQWAYQSWTHDPVVVGIFVHGGVIKKYEIDAGGGFYRLYGGSGGGACSDPVPFPGQEPATCSDGSLTAGEDGIDCGGDCSAVCTSWCGGDYQLIDGICVASSLPDSFGNCASGFTSDPAGMCTAWKDPVLAKEDYTPNDLTPFLTDHFDNTPIDTGTDIVVSTVDNGDGTSTITTTTTTTNNTSNTSSTSTETTNIDNSTGATISSTIETVGDDSPEENPNNYNYQVNYGDMPVFDSDISADIPEKTEMSGIIDNFIDNFPLFSVLDNQSMSLDNTVCAAPPVNIYGTDLTISLCRWEDFLKSLGVIFVIVAQSAAVFIVIRGWKAS